MLIEALFLNESLIAESVVCAEASDWSGSHLLIGTNR